MVGINFYRPFFMPSFVICSEYPELIEMIDWLTLSLVPESESLNLKIHLKSFLS